MGLVKEINHVNVKEMETWEMDAGFSLALGLPTRKTLVDGRPCAEVLRDDVWTTFSPTCFK